MNRNGLLCICAVTAISVFSGRAEGCEGHPTASLTIDLAQSPNVYLVGGTYYASVDTTVVFDATESEDPDEGYWWWLDDSKWIREYYWDFDDGTAYYEDAFYGHGGCIEGDMKFDGLHAHTFTSPGLYTVSLEVTDDDAYEGYPPEKSSLTPAEVTIMIVEVDIGIAGVDEEHEESPGGYLGANLDDDDDDKDCDWDNDDDGTVSEEDNLKAITISVQPDDETLDGAVRVRLNAGEQCEARIWEQSTKVTKVIPTNSSPAEYYRDLNPNSLLDTYWLECGDAIDSGITVKYVVDGNELFQTDCVAFHGVKITSIDVEESLDDKTEKFDSVQSESSVPDDHFVTAKGSGNIYLKASLDPDTADTRELLTWTGMTQDSQDKRIAHMGRSSAAEYDEKNVNFDGASMREFTNWVVWASATDPNYTYDEAPAEDGIWEDVEQNKTEIHGGYEITFQIEPASIAQGYWPPCEDIPDLDLTKDSDPPDVPEDDWDTVLHYDDLYLAYGATDRWDASRQITQDIDNPDGLNLEVLISSVEVFITDYSEWPNPVEYGEDVVGNDDWTTEHEKNNPYTSPAGTLWAEDGPKDPIHHEEGNLGNTYEKHLYFRSFARLNLRGRWFRISGNWEWETHIKAKMENTSEAEFDLDFNNDGDKDDTVPIWRDNGSYNTHE